MATSLILATDPATGESVEYTPPQIAQSAIALNDLSDAAVAGVANGDALVYSSVDASWINYQMPMLYAYMDANGTSNGTNLTNVYAFLKGTMIVSASAFFTLTPTTNRITYTGVRPIVALVSFSYTMFSGTDNQMIWTNFMKNPPTDTTAAVAMPNYPPNYIPGSNNRTIARNLNAVITTAGTVQFPVSLVNGDFIRCYTANMTAGNGTVAREFRVSIRTLSFA